MTKTTHGRQNFKTISALYKTKDDKTYFSGGARKWPLRLALNTILKGASYLILVTYTKLLNHAHPGFYFYRVNLTGRD
jgi:hypothetical protein